MKGFFDREIKIRTHAQMMERLQERTKGKGTLTWNKPARNPDDTGRQTAAGTDYEIRKTITEGKVMYWAWANKKLLGYVGTSEAARKLCQGHADAQAASP